MKGLRLCIHSVGVDLQDLVIQVVLPHALIGDVTLFLWVVGSRRQRPIRDTQNEVHRDLTTPKKGSDSQARTAAGSSTTTASPSTSGRRHWSPGQYTVAGIASESSLSTSPNVCIHSSLSLRLKAYSSNP
jgi:hypothetical protein